MGLRTGKFAKKVSILNTYSPYSNYEFEGIKDSWRIVNNFVHKQPEKLIKCWRTDNNGQPQHTNENKNVIGRWTLRNTQPNINGLHLTKTCERNDYVRCNTFFIPKTKRK